MNPTTDVVKEGEEHGLQTATDNATDSEQILNERSGQGSSLGGRSSQPPYKHARPLTLKLHPYVSLQKWPADHLAQYHLCSELEVGPHITISPTTETPSYIQAK